MTTHDEGDPAHGRRRGRPRLPLFSVVEHECGKDTRDPDEGRACNCEAQAEAEAPESNEETRR